MARKVCNLNKSSVEEISKITGIGRKDAQKLIDYRKEHGPFRNWEEFNMVPGCDASLIAKLKTECDISE